MDDFNRRSTTTNGSAQIVPSHPIVAACFRRGQVKLTSNENREISWIFLSESPWNVKIAWGDWLFHFTFLTCMPWRGGVPVYRACLTVSNNLQVQRVTEHNVPLQQFSSFLELSFQLMISDCFGCTCDLTDQLFQSSQCPDCGPFKGSC